jgi:DNA repair protein RecO
MTSSATCQAIVLKTYDCGEADRLCILLSDMYGRIAVRAKAVRKIESKWGSSVQSFQHLTVDLSEHSSGWYLQSALCVDSFSTLRSDLRKFVMAGRGAELLLHFLHDTEPSERIFSLAREYFEECHAGAPDLLFPTFQMMLLDELGLLPAFERDGTALSSYLRADASLSERSRMALGKGELEKVRALCDALLREHLSFPMRSGKVALAL